MNRRAILAALIASGTSLFSRFAWAGSWDEGSPGAAAGSPRQPIATIGANGRGARAARGFPDLKFLGPGHQVRSLAYSRGAYRVETADGKTMHYLEADLRFKIDSSGLGPRPGAPVIMPAGTEGDRVWVFFASPAEISSFIDYDWS
jgi:hypothetical protein